MRGAGHVTADLRGDGTPPQIAPRGKEACSKTPDRHRVPFAVGVGRNSSLKIEQQENQSDCRADTQSPSPRESLRWRRHWLRAQGKLPPDCDAAPEKRG